MLLCSCWEDDGDGGEWLGCCEGINGVLFLRE